MRPAGLAAAAAAAVVASTSWSGAEAKKPLPVAVEARFKERITAKLEDSLNGALAHLAFALGVADDQQTLPKDTFAPGYELDVGTGEGAGTWLSRCEDIVEGSRDSVAYCAVHKLQALTAFCEVGGAAEHYREGVLRLLRGLLGKREVMVPGLGLKRSLLPIGNSMEAWMAETPQGSGRFDVAITAHSAAMLAVVQCASALGNREMLGEIGSWFAALEKAYPRSTWKHQSFHLNGILWETLVVVLSKIRSDSSFAEDIQEYAADLESYMQALFAEDGQVWSFSAARAAVLSWSTATKATRRKRLGSAVDEYMRRWVELIPKFNFNVSYSCGPLQGVAPLLLKRGDQAAELVGSTLKMMEKDVDLFQVVAAADGDQAASSLAAGRLGQHLLSTHGATLHGAFYRDQAQLQSEKRTTIRIDDTAQCVLALSRVLDLLDDLVGVDVGEGGGGATPPPSDAPRSAEL